VIRSDRRSENLVQKLISADRPSEKGVKIDTFRSAIWSYNCRITLVFITDLQSFGEFSVYPCVFSRLLKDDGKKRAGKLWICGCYARVGAEARDRVKIRIRVRATP